MNPRLPLIRLLLLIVIPGLGFGQTLPVLQPGNQTVIKAARDKALQQVNNNLNRFALAQLQYCNSTMDSLTAAEISDSLRLIDSTYRAVSSNKLSTLQSLKKQSEALTVTRDGLLTEQHALLRKAALAFACWLVLVLLLIQFRRKRVRAAQLLLDTGISHQSVSENLSAAASTLFSTSRHLLSAFEQLAHHASAMLRDVKASADKAATGSDQAATTAQLVKDVSVLEQAAGRELALCRHLIGQEADWGQEKTKCNLNKLCDEYAEIAQRGSVREDAPELVIGRDLEKNLPGIDLHAEAVGSVLLNIFSNAVRAVRVKQSGGLKGYQPKITVSTRVLPRFLQVRIKDNGTGMPDEVQKQLFTEFYSAWNDQPSAGLGLSESKKVMEVLHKGEIRIESSTSDGTDVYLKFFTS